MFCKKCGKAIGDDNKFCLYCGASLTTVNANTGSNINSEAYRYSTTSAGNAEASDYSQQLLHSIWGVTYFKQPKTVYDAQGPLKVYGDHLEFEVSFGGGVGNAFGLVGIAVARSNARKDGSTIVIRYSDIRSVTPWSSFGQSGMCIELNDGRKPCFVKLGQSVTQAMDSIKSITGK